MKRNENENFVKGLEETGQINNKQDGSNRGSGLKIETVVFEGGLGWLIGKGGALRRKNKFERWKGK